MGPHFSGFGLPKNVTADPKVVQSHEEARFTLVVQTKTCVFLVGNKGIRSHAIPKYHFCLSLLSLFAQREFEVGVTRLHSYMRLPYIFYVETRWYSPKH